MLVLEQDIDVSTTFRRMLETLGHAVIVVSSAADACAVLSRQRIGVVLTNQVSRIFKFG